MRPATGTAAPDSGCGAREPAAPRGPPRPEAERTRGRRVCAPAPSSSRWPGRPRAAPLAPPEAASREDRRQTREPPRGGGGGGGRTLRCFVMATSQRARSAAASAPPLAPLAALAAAWRRQRGPALSSRAAAATTAWRAHLGGVACRLHPGSAAPPVLPQRGPWRGQHSQCAWYGYGGVGESAADRRLARGREVRR